MAPSLDAIIKAGEVPQDAVDLGDGIYMSKGIANAYLITTDDGSVLVNTGLDFEAPEHDDRFRRVSDGPLRAIVFTQGHPDHVGGWSHFDGPGVATIAQANHPDVREYWRRLHPFYVRRIMKLWGRFTTSIDASQLPPEPALTETFTDSHTFEMGGRHFELYATPGGEAVDSLIVWLPEIRLVSWGTCWAPCSGTSRTSTPFAATRVRSAMTFLHSVDRVLDLAPETLVNGHDTFRGATEIGDTLTRVRDATAHLREQTIAGMNAGTDLWALMREVTLPAQLAIPQLHGKVPWIVRTIWEEHTGWFRYESTTELYDVPPSAVWADLYDLAGGTGALVARAQERLEDHEPLHALHLLDIALDRSPLDVTALRAKRQALTALLADSGRENFSEVQWLEAEIAEIDAALG